MSWRFPHERLNPNVHGQASFAAQTHELPATGAPAVIMGIPLQPGVPLDNQEITARAPNFNTLRGRQDFHPTGIFRVVSAPAVHVYANPSEAMRQASPAVRWQPEEEQGEGVMHGERLLYRPNIRVVDFYARNASKTQAGQEETFYCTKKGPEKCIFCRKPQTQPSPLQPPGNDILVEHVST